MIRPTYLGTRGSRALEFSDCSEEKILSSELGIQDSDWIFLRTKPRNARPRCFGTPLLRT